MGGASCSSCGDAAHFVVTHRGQEQALCAVCIARLTPGIDVVGLVDAALAGNTPAGYCPACEYTEKEFRASGLLGCPVCYVIFRPVAG
jgi:protein-arginine kinase activator protein McsA